MTRFSNAKSAILAPSGLPSIATRLRRLVITSVAIALAVASGLTIRGEVEQNLRSARQTLLATAEVFASAMSRDVADGNTDSVMQTLRAVSRMRSLKSAEVRDTSGTVIAVLGRGTRLEGDVDLSPTSRISLFDLMESRTIQTQVPVVNDGKTVGSVLLVSEASGFTRQIISKLTTLTVGSLLALGLGLLLTARVQRQMSQPLLALTATASLNARQGKFETVPEDGRDRETVDLARTFNAMVTTIRAGNETLLAREAEIVDRLARASEYRDDETGQHIHRVAAVSELIAEALGLDKTFTENLRHASPMHDIGKIAIRDKILHKPGPLTQEERVEMQLHALKGFDILAGSPSTLVQLASEIALSHHERWDGTGYPNRLKGEAIPLSGRITAVADVCDALLSQRPYKQAWTLDAVREHLRKESGRHFDPRCVEAILGRWSDVAALYDPAVDCETGKARVA